MKRIYRCSFPGKGAAGKSVICLLLLAILLSGCTVFAADTEATALSPAPVFVMSSPAPDTRAGPDWDAQPFPAESILPPAQTEPFVFASQEDSSPEGSEHASTVYTEPAAADLHDTGQPQDLQEASGSIVSPAETGQFLPNSPPPSLPSPDLSAELPSGAKVWQAGDTTPTWNPALAAAFPADTECSDPVFLEKWMTVEGLSLADLDARGCDQLILTAAQPTDGVESLTVCYERGANGSFAPAAGLSRMSGHVGKCGIRHNRQRNTNTSPAGLWAISSAFGNELPPEDLNLPWRQVTPNSDWVCDENSPYFNTWQERGDPSLTGSWSDDVEHLEDYPVLYAWACVIEFNRPPDVIPSRGCAIFLHCSDKATGGCIGLPRESMLRVLRWLNPDKHPYILITGVEY